MNRKVKLLTGLLMTLVLGAAVADAASSPSVATGSASSITASAAILNGTVNPNGASTSYRFDWGLTTAYGQTSAVKSAGAGTKVVPAAARIKGLLPGTFYHYRLGALNKFGGTEGADRRFRTAGNPPPEAATGPAEVTSASTATVTGVINPHGENTTYEFQFGPTTAYGSASRSFRRAAHRSTCRRSSPDSLKGRSSTTESSPPMALPCFSTARTGRS
jgi:hypothetical protein